MSPERLTIFCPACWAKVAESSPTCSRCGTDMEGVQAQRDFMDKLIAALGHPEPETRALAVMILGWRGGKRGVDPLLHVVLQEDDAYLVEAAVEALGRIGGPRVRYSGDLRDALPESAEDWPCPSPAPSAFSRGTMAANWNLEVDRSAALAGPFTPRPPAS